jgi:hypothetical protein
MRLAKTEALKIADSISRQVSGNPERRHAQQSPAFAARRSDEIGKTNAVKSGV